jgi:hypothetical protein
MPISGKFEADFGGFVGEVERSVVSLDKLDNKSVTVGTSMVRMIEGFSGRKVIADAVLMAEAVDKVGGAAMLTEKELRAVGLRATEATAKLRALGVDVPPKIQKLADAWTAVGSAVQETTPKVKSLHGAFTSFDGALASMGVNIGPEVRGLTELGSAAGQTAGELGAVATVGLAVAAGIGGWKIGRAAAEFFDLDVKIGNATAKLLGWGDVAGQVAASKADVLARASAAVGMQVNNLSNAIAINIAAHKDWRAGVTASADVVAGWRAELTKVKGDLPSLTKDLASHNFTVEDLAKRYHLSAGALQFFTQEQERAKTATEKATAIIQAHNATMLHALAAEVAARKEVAAVTARSQLELTKLEEQYNVTRIAQGGTANAIAIQQIQSWEAVTAESFHKAGIVAAEVYAQLHLNATQALDAVGVDTDALRAHSIASLEEIARNAQRTFEAATLYSGGMTREGIDHFRQLRDEAVNALHATGVESGATFAHMRDDVDRTSFTFRNWLANMATDAEKAALGLDKVTAATARATGAVTSVTQDRYSPEEYIAVAARLHTTADAVRAMVTAGAGSIEEILRAGLAAIRGNSEAALDLWTAMGGATPGSRPPGFAGGVTNFSGGAAWVGERGPELVTLPRGSDVLPFGRGGGGPPVVNHFYVNGTGEEVARQVGDILMRQAKRSTLYGAA